MYWNREDAEKFARDWIWRNYRWKPGKSSSGMFIVPITYWERIIAAAYEAGREDEHRDPKH